MDPSKTILVCFLVIMPVVGYLAWRFWNWYILQDTMAMEEAGEFRRQSGMPQTVAS